MVKFSFTYKLQCMYLIYCENVAAFPLLKNGTVADGENRAATAAVYTD